MKERERVELWRLWKLVADALRMYFGGHEHSSGD
jgi:hypothetical protein